jgi:hypothetical protein
VLQSRLLREGRLARHFQTTRTDEPTHDASSREDADVHTLLQEMALVLSLTERVKDSLLRKKDSGGP